MTRAAGLARLAAVAPRMGQDYAAGRNTDRRPGPDGAPVEATTSMLSPYLRRRLVLETEVIEAALRAHGPAAGKLVEEVAWRAYLKGHLETRPALWAQYRRLVTEGHHRLGAQDGLRRAYQAAVEGRTGIDCFDDWAGELAARNWLHNHARMWFASIWIFTLRLPWALGAELFLRHLLDGDPASNTLSWRWVAGLHTRGKPYAARRENIRRYTEGRYDPTGLNEDPVALEEDETAPLVALPLAGPLPRGEVALLLHLEDLHPESLPLDGARVTRVAGLVAHAEGAAEPVRRADEQAMADALSRAAACFGCPVVPFGEGWADGLPIVTAWAPVGPSAGTLPPGCARLRREWDELTWLHATRGYYKVRSQLPGILGELGLRAA